MARTLGISVIPIPLQGEILPGDDLAEKLRLALRREKQSLKAGDILVIKHKIVSKAEGQIVSLSGVKPSRAARAWARTCGGDVRLVHLVMSESRGVVRKRIIGGRGVLI